MQKPPILVGLSICLNLACEASPARSSCPHTVSATKCAEGVILCEYGLLLVEHRSSIFRMEAISQKRKAHYGLSRKEWPVVVSMSKGEAFELQQLLSDVVDECVKVGATGSNRFDVMQGLLGKVSKQRRKPVLFLTN